ncbi:hypothetical protein HYH03_003885 [Edaphochlamys debaryana]|uniref:Uncharacterized protein n=1 Tax=Edaphochlamys debaryana TaxID=47281 RepID=A0A835YAX8_9CHLO|nr:hypothetical protein HYH03_003885 [Edaphochlamys debaryana]|eukprot:KAG2498127.1 hypothetical protein HYH03_003885 [Edaphochlamys debaryana]
MEDGVTLLRPFVDVSCWAPLPTVELQMEGDLLAAVPQQVMEAFPQLRVLTIYMYEEVYMPEEEDEEEEDEAEEEEDEAAEEEDEDTAALASALQLLAPRLHGLSLFYPWGDNVLQPALASSLRGATQLQELDLEAFKLTTWEAAAPVASLVGLHSLRIRSTTPRIAQSLLQPLTALVKLDVGDLLDVSWISCLPRLACLVCKALFAPDGSGPWSLPPKLDHLYLTGQEPERFPVLIGPSPALPLFDVRLTLIPDPAQDALLPEQERALRVAAERVTALGAASSSVAVVCCREGDALPVGGAAEKLTLCAAPCHVLPNLLLLERLSKLAELIIIHHREAPESEEALWPVLALLLSNATVHVQVYGVALRPAAKKWIRAKMNDMHVNGKRLVINA